MKLPIQRHAAKGVSLLLWMVVSSCVTTSEQSSLHVGGSSINRTDVEYAADKTRCYGDTLGTQESAAVRLVSDLLEFEVLKSAFEDTPPDTALRATAAQILRTTQDSATLACILSIGDVQRYYRFVVRPTLVNGRLRARYSSDSALHAPARDTIKRIFEHLREDPAHFMQERLDTLRIPRASELAQDPFVEQVLSRMKIGRLWPHIIETDTDFRIVMLHGRSDSLYIAIITRAWKQPFDAWFRDFVNREIPIAFTDRAFEASLRRQYPGLWWLPQVLD